MYLYPSKNGQVTDARATSGPTSPLSAEFGPLFLNISGADCEKLWASGRQRRIARREMLYVAGDPVRQIFVLISGLVKIVQLGVSGAESIVRVASPGDVLGSVELVSNTGYRTTAMAMRDSRALVLDSTTFGSLVDRHPVLLRNVLRIAANHLSELEERFCEVANEKVSARVARQVIRLLQPTAFQTAGCIEIVLSREELAQMTGTTLFTVSRLFSAWALEGIVAPRREGVTILDLPALRAMAEKG